MFSALKCYNIVAYAIARPSYATIPVFLVELIIDRAQERGSVDSTQEDQAYLKFMSADSRSKSMNNKAVHCEAIMKLNHADTRCHVSKYSSLTRLNSVTVIIRSLSRGVYLSGSCTILFLVLDNQLQLNLCPYRRNFVSWPFTTPLIYVTRSQL